MPPPLKELMELQKQIDESARAIVKSVRTLVDHRSEYRPVRAADYPERDAAFYDCAEKELAAEGVRPLGDFEDAAFSRRHRSRVRAAGALPRLLRGLEDLLAGYADDEAASASFREQQGLALFEPM